MQVKWLRKAALNLEDVPGTRELVVQPYPFLIPYRVKGEEIHILRVFHTRLRLPSHW